ncbi:MAG: sigma 54-interacting transcriptional regulator [Deltaproteobacteria bacterium]|nr:sigma 54-interacting transcriptional regulator [Deltaproteobacteria bacterium]
MPELVLTSDGKPVLRCPLHGQAVSVGRSSANDVSVPDDAMPPLHCSFEPQGGGRYRVVDRGGQGVFVGGAEYEHKDLEDGDEVRLGHLIARFLVGAEESGTTARKDGAQHTGILRTRAGDGALTRLDLRLRLPASAGGRVLEIPPEGLRIGAHPDNDVVIDDGFVSSFHAQIFLRGERLFVRDLDSTNGTFVGAVRVVEAEVPLGSTIKLGKAELVADSKESEEKVEAPSGDGPWRCCDLHTADATFARTFAFIEKVAPHDATVCVFGETGSGKELVAQAIHKLSGRKHGPFVPLNCAAIPQNLIESELFGHEKGAFTGADRQRQGAFEEANKGTLFLDEVGELAMDVQAKLLRVLETRAVRRLGGRGDIAVDVRVVAATHRDLLQHVREGKFREDLLHRLYVIPVNLPPLRERRADVGHLAQHFIGTLSPGGRKPELTTEARKKLERHPFPGNVRELRNVIQRALIVGDGKQVTEKDIVFIPVTLAEATLVGQVYRPGMTMDEVEREAYRGALKSFGSAAEAARALGLPKTTFWRRATALGLLADKKGA